MSRKPTGNKVGRPSKAKLNDRQLEAVKIEYEHIRWGDFFTSKRPGEMSSWMPSSELAKQLKVGVRTVQKWRNDPLYISALIDRFSAKLRLAIERDERAERALAAKIRKEHLDRVSPVLVEAHAQRHWTGPFESPVDGSVIASQREYVEDLERNKCLPAEHVKMQLKAALSSLKSRPTRTMGPASRGVGAGDLPRPGGDTTPRARGRPRSTTS